MRFIVVALALLLSVAAVGSAQTSITCSAANVSQQDAADYAAMLVSVNAVRASQGLPTLPNFNAHCSDVMLSLLSSWNSQIQAQESARVGQKASATGRLTAAPAACTYAGLSAGCLRIQVACYVLTAGANTTCQ
jgi:hypothetical protein